MNKSEIKTEEDIRRFLSDKATEFQKAVYIATFKIPHGKVSTYKRIAEKSANHAPTELLPTRYISTLFIP